MTLLDRLRVEEARARGHSACLINLADRLAAILDELERLAEHRPVVPMAHAGHFLQIVAAESRYYALMESGEIVYRDRESSLRSWTSFYHVPDHPPFVSIAALGNVVVAMSADGVLWWPPLTGSLKWRSA